VNDIWERVWTDVGDAFGRLAVSLRVRHPTLFWTAGHQDNNAFPFRAYASFNQPSRQGEDIVASVDFHRADDQLQYSCDIIVDDGTILAEGPEGIIDVSRGIAPARAEIEQAVGRMIQFLEASEKILSDAVAQRPQ
jgi:hypothetical protein